MEQKSESISIIVDNRAGNNLIAEHGLSILISTFNNKFLFDTGQGHAFINNTKAMNINLNQINALVISHGHYDHTGGIHYFLESNSSTKIFLHPQAPINRFSIHNAQIKDISMPDSIKYELSNLEKCRVYWITKPLQIACGIWVIGKIPRTNNIEDTGGSFFLDPDGSKPDPIKDDMALWIKTAKGIIVIFGCCHSGLVNTLEFIRTLSNKKTITGIIGGLHLVNANEKRLNFTLDYLNRVKPEFIIPCHCPGEQAINLMKRKINTKILDCSSGLRWEITT